MIPNAAYVVTVTPTIMSGTVVRWFDSVEGAERCNPLVSASEDAVIIHRKCLPPAELATVMPLAEKAGHDLSRGRRDEVEVLATHRRQGLLGPIVPVEKPE